MLASDRVLGPRWSVKELRTFYILLKAYDKQWERLEERLPSRTNAMIRGLYDMHRGYLSLPEASVEGFCTIMMDHYKNMDELLGVTGRQEEVEAQTVDSKEHVVFGLARLQVEEHQSAATTPSGTRVRTSSMKEEGVNQDTRSKKRRKLDRFLARDDHVSIDQSSVDPKQHGTPQHMRKTTFAKSPVNRRRQWFQGPTHVKLASRKFDLPWFYWFYSYVDVDFFLHNEFVECLHRMGLGKITTAARPIWSSVRASMGRPRRLSPLFLAQEKEKLRNYRTLKRQSDMSPDVQANGWPYRCPMKLKTGVSVLARLEHPRRFAVGVIENYSLKDGVCKVRLDSNGSRVCSLDSVMLLPESSQTTVPIIISKSPAPVKVDHAVAMATDMKPTLVSTNDKLTTILLVKELLKRKELIVNAMTTMNDQARIRREIGSRNSKGSTDQAKEEDKTVFQRQYAWLVVNLDVTNRYLRSALLRLQDITNGTKANGSALTAASNDATSVAAVPVSTAHTSAAPLISDVQDSATLTLDHMRWAVNFLAVSRKKSGELVNGMENTREPSEHANAELLPETKELIANCVTLMSVLRRGSSPDIPPLITQKLLERLFELLEPNFEANMDLYAELRAAAEGVAVMQQQTSYGGAPTPRSS